MSHKVCYILNVVPHDYSFSIILIEFFNLSWFKDQILMIHQSYNLFNFYTIV